MNIHEYSNPVEPLLDLASLRVSLGVSESTVRRLVARGDLATLRIGRRRFVERHELARFLGERRRTPGAKP